MGRSTELPILLERKVLKNQIEKIPSIYTIRKSIKEFRIISSESCSGTRVIRKEEGKVAEIFTLVIKGTMEENWHSTSNVGTSYIEITERELDDILGGEQSTNKEQEGKEMDLLFRL